MTGQQLRRPVSLAMLGGFLLAAILIGVSIGPAGSLTRASWTIVWQIRMPRVALGAIVGATLSLAGASYQGVFRNPLIDPYLLGAAGGAGLGATVVIAFGRPTTASWPVDPLPAAAFAGAIAAVAVSYAIGTRASEQSRATSLILSGVAVASVTAAVQAFILQRASSGVVKSVYEWILGSLAHSSWSRVLLILPYFLCSSGVLLLHGRHLDLLRIGDDEAATLGLNVARLRLVVVVAATIGTAAAVSVSGLISFVGIIVPHVARMLTGASYRRLLATSMIGGAGFLILADTIARTAQSPAETPIGIVTAFVGAPFFLALLVRARIPGR